MPQALAERRADAPGVRDGKQAGLIAATSAAGICLPTRSAGSPASRTATYQPAEILMNADQLLDAIVADKGGANAMSALERSLAAKLRDTDIRLTSSENIMVRAGLNTPEGRRSR